jgi:hypothetical protein
MDPYVESPDIWPDFHDRLAEQISRDLNRALNQVYDAGPYARGAVDYGRPPDPPLKPECSAWLTACLERREPAAGAPA